MASTTDTTVQFLHKVPMFQGLNDRQLERLARSFVKRSFPAGENMVTQGQGGIGFFIIVSGKAEAVRTRSDGTKVVVNTFGPTDFFGEMALLDDGLRTATVTAVEASDCLLLKSWDFISILKDDAEMAVAILQELAKRFRMALDRLQ
jgi:CRP/FNR family cyclic AMP-dependent transcriptional regulator